MDATIVTKPITEVTSKPLSCSGVSGCPLEHAEGHMDLRGLHVRRRLGNDNYNDVHHECTDGVGDSTLNGHLEAVGALFGGILIDRVGVLESTLVSNTKKDSSTRLGYYVHTLTYRCNGSSRRISHAVWDVYVQDGDEDVRCDGESDGQATQNLEVVSGIPLQPVNRNRQDTVENE
jgi:hypothetical protein